MFTPHPRKCKKFYSDYVQRFSDLSSCYTHPEDPADPLLKQSVSETVEQGGNAFPSMMPDHLAIQFNAGRGIGTKTRGLKHIFPDEFRS